MAGKGGHAEVGQHFSRTKALVLVPGDEHNTVQFKHGNDEGRKWARTVKGDQDHPSPPKLSEPFPERSDCTW